MPVKVGKVKHCTKTKTKNTRNNAKKEPAQSYTCRTPPPPKKGKNHVTHVYVCPGYMSSPRPSQLPIPYSLISGLTKIDLFSRHTKPVVSNQVLQAQMPPKSTNSFPTQPADFAPRQVAPCGYAPRPGQAPNSGNCKK
jgi:hypothetical protein